MASRDYECRYCGSPRSYDCLEWDSEEEDGDCEVDGSGYDEAVLELYAFKRKGAPSSEATFWRRRGEALRSERRVVAYNSGAGEFEPSLNFRAVLTGASREASRAVWRLNISAQSAGGGVTSSEHSAIAIPYEKDELVWVVNACPVCAAIFEEGEDPDDPPCRLYFEQVAEHHDLEYPDGADTDGKLTFLRERFAAE